MKDNSEKRIKFRQNGRSSPAILTLYSIICSVVQKRKPQSNYQKIELNRI